LAWNVRGQWNDVVETDPSQGNPRAFSIGDRALGAGAPVYVIAEAGVNHDGDLDVALRLVDAARDAGADAVKFQTFDAEQLVTADAPQAEYQVRNTGARTSQLAMLRQLELDDTAHLRLVEHCRDRGITFLSTPFDARSVDLLGQLGVPAFKIGSGELTNLPLLQHAAATGRPLLLSTGMAHLGEVEAAVRAVRGAGNHDLALLHCVSNYPADPADVNLRAMQTLAETFDVAAGYSDHTLGDEVILAAVALGAAVVEKHFTLDATRPGPDHAASIEPDALAQLVRRVRAVESALGHGRKIPAASESCTASVARRSVVAAAFIAAGTTLTADHLAVRRPGTGLPPARLPDLVGRVAGEPIAAGTVLTWEMLS
jgi:N,N'-diacetyllegionaminate synthase